MRSIWILILLAALLCAGAPDAAAQQHRTGYQYLYLLDWPPALYERAPDDADEMLYPYDLLPLIDRLTLGYAYAVEDGLPAMDFLLSWKPGAYGVLDNRVVPFDELPDDVRIVAVDLSAVVYVEDEPVAHLRIALDSLMLAAAPDEYGFANLGAPWDAVFANTTADDARAYFADGFTLRNLTIDRIAFASFGQEAPEVEREPGVAYPPYPPYPPRVGVYPPDVIIWVDWIFRPGAGKRGAVGPPQTPREGIGRDLPSDPERPRTRGGQEGEPDEGGEDRTPRTRTGDRDEAAADRDKAERPRPGKSGKKTDDDDDDEELLPAALAGLAALGVVAFVGGTVGYYGNAEAPLGLTSGFVLPQGGALLQVAVNEAVLGAGGREKLLGKVTGFYDVFKTPLQPSMSLGVLAEEHGDDIELTPSLAFGAVGNFGRFLLFGGYDLTAQGVDFGVAINFRSKK